LPVQFFSAAISRQAYAAGQLESLADKLTGGSLAPLITHLVQEKRIPRGEVERIRAILDEGEDREE
jgi:predicted transcriptional regulator